MKIYFSDSTMLHDDRSRPGGPAYFSRHLVEFLGASGHDVAVGADLTPEEAALIDVVVFEWCDDVARAVAEAGTAKRIVIRMRGFDVWGDLETFPWRRVHALVFESELLHQLAIERCPLLPELVTTAVIPSGIDIERFPFRERRPGPNVAIAARAIPDKGFQLMFEWARTRPRYKLHVALTLAQDPRFFRYLQHSAPVNVRLYQEVNTPVWLNAIDANFLASASTWETLGYSIIEAMAMGIKPVIHDYPYATTVWPPDFLWRDFAQLDRMIAGSYDSREYRAIVEGVFDARIQTAQFIAAFIGDAASSMRQ